MMIEQPPQQPHDPSHHVEQTIELNLSHFTSKPQVECSEHAAYDQFLQFLNRHHHIYTKSKLTALKDAIESTLFNIEAMKESVYMARCCMFMLALYLQDENNFKLAVGGIDQQQAQITLFTERHVNQLLALANVDNIHHLFPNLDNDNNSDKVLHEQDETILRIGAIDAISLMLNSRFAYHWFITQNGPVIVDQILFNGLKHQNLYVRDSIANLFVRVLYLSSIVDQESHHPKSNISTYYSKLIDNFYKQFPRELFDFVLTLVHYAFSPIEMNETLLQIQLSRLSMLNESSRSMASVIESFLVDHQIIPNYVVATCSMKGAIGSSPLHHDDYTLLSKAMDVLISLSKSNRSSNGTNALSLLSEDESSTLDQLCSILLCLLTTDEKTIELATRSICSFHSLTWHQNVNANLIGTLITRLFHTIQSLLEISVIPISKEEIFSKLQQLNPKKKVKLMNLLLKSVTHLINTQANNEYCDNIHQLLLTIIQEFESVQSGVLITVLHLLHQIETRQNPTNITTTTTTTETEDSSYKKQLMNQLFHRFKTSNHSGIVMLIGSILPKMCFGSQPLQLQYCNVIYDRLFDYSWEIRDSCLCLVKQMLMQLEYVHILPIVTLLFENRLNRETPIQHILLNKLSDMQQFVRLTAVSVLELMLERKLYHADPSSRLQVYSALAKTIAISEFDVRKAVLLSFEKLWISTTEEVNNHHSAFSQLMQHDSFIEAMQCGVDKIYNEFDFESSYYVLTLTEQICRICTHSVDLGTQIILELHLLNIVEEAIVNHSVPRNQRIASDIVEQLLTWKSSSTAGVFTERMKRLESELAQSGDELLLVDQIEQQQQHSSGGGSRVDVVDFFNFDHEQYDCY